MGEESKKKQPTVLLVEDDTFLAGMYIAKFDAEQINILLATDGESGLTLALKEKPDLILLDILLPKRDGWSVLEALKKNNATKSIPVVLLTNLGEKKDIDRARKLGAADYLIKAHHMPSEILDLAKGYLK